MMNQRCTPLGVVSLPVPGTSTCGFTNATVGTTAFVIPSNANMALIVAQTGAVTWRDDGVAPNITSGMPINPTFPQSYFEYSGNLAAIRFCGVTGTVSIVASFYGLEG
jgi:hypothetical protein